MGGRSQVYALIRMAVLFISVVVVGFSAASWETPRNTSGTGHGALRSVSRSGRQQNSSETRAIHDNCSEAAARLDRTLAAMVPGRTWTWQLDAERSRKRLDELQSILAALRDCEDNFEVGLTPEQKSKVEPELKLMQRLGLQLESHAQNLKVELQKRYPARWRVARDVSDMQTQIHKWRNLHEQIETPVGTNHHE